MNKNTAVCVIPALFLLSTPSITFGVEKTLTLSTAVNAEYGSWEGTNFTRTMQRFNPEWGMLTGFSSGFSGGSWNITYQNTGMPEGDPAQFSAAIGARIGSSEGLGGTSGGLCGEYACDTPPQFPAVGATSNVSGTLSRFSNKSSSYSPWFGWFIGDTNFDVNFTASFRAASLAGAPASIQFTDARLSSTFNIQYTYEAPVTTAVQLKSDQYTPFSSNANKLVVVSDVTTATPIATVSTVVGDALVRRASGQEEWVTAGMTLYLGDAVETGTDGAVNLLLSDNSSFAMTDNKLVTVGEYIQEPTTQTGSSFWSFMKGVLVYTSELIGQDSNATVQDVPVGDIGSRGDAGEIIQRAEDPLGLNETQLAALNPAAMLTTGSPVSLSTAVDVPDQPFSFNFDYGFLDETGTLELYLGDYLLFSSTADADNVGKIFSTAIDVDDGILSNLDAAILSFNFDGPTGSRLLLDDILFAGLINGDFSNLDTNWFVEGAGKAELVGMMASPVPIPAAAWLFCSGMLGLIGVAKRKTV